MTTTPTRPRPATEAQIMNGPTEKAWSQTVYDVARLLGWRAYRVLNSRGSTPGVPDLMLLRGHRLVFAELKTERGKPTTAQREWLAELGAVDGVESYLWRPSDWDDVTEVLR